MKNFLETLSSNNRLGVLPGVCEKFAQLVSAARGEVEMTVTSAASLDPKVVRQLETAVGKSQYVGAGKKLKVVTKVGDSSFFFFINLYGAAAAAAAVAARKPSKGIFDQTSIC